LKNKSAFTMIELVFVIVVLGILASLAMGRMDRDLRQEAAETILSHIRLAQQLALRDNKHLPTNAAYSNEWQGGYWTIYFRSCSGSRGSKWLYRVGSNTNSDDKLGSGATSIKRIESAINPIDGKYIWTNSCKENKVKDTETPSTLLTKQFGIKNISNEGGCSSQYIAFDYLGRPHNSTAYNATADFRHVMNKDCNFTFTMSSDVNNDGGIDNNDNFIITIKKETGYAFIVGQETL
jgi:prepilin-type N-terminal cleavage/methylation domain-containing protein